MQSAIDDFNKHGKGVQVAYHLNTRLVGSRKKMTHEVNITDLEYADDMSLVSSSCDNLTAMMTVLNQYCLGPENQFQKDQDSGSLPTHLSATWVCGASIDAV